MVQLRELNSLVKTVCDAFQQNREQITQDYFEIWTTEVGIGVKNELSVDFKISFFFHFVS